MKKISALIAIAALSLSTGCATIIKGSTEKITVNSLEEGTVIYVNGAPRGKDNVQVDIKKGKPQSIRATKKGCQDVVIETTESFDGTSLLGILIDFGLISIPIDLISGAAWKPDPTTYTVSPICQEEASKV